MPERPAQAGLSFRKHRERVARFSFREPCLLLQVPSKATCLAYVVPSKARHASSAETRAELCSALQATISARLLRSARTECAAPRQRLRSGPHKAAPRLRTRVPSRDAP